MAVQRFLAIVGNKVQEVVAAAMSTGSAQAGQVPALNASGVLDPTLINLSTLNPATLPTTLPSTAGVLWNNNGVLSIS